VIRVSLNGAPRSLAAGATVARLVAELGPATRGIAVAVNEEVVPRSTWAHAPLRDGDRVEVLRAAQGG
jgi:sulfur carrier protein